MHARVRERERERESGSRQQYVTADAINCEWRHLPSGPVFLFRGTSAIVLRGAWMVLEYRASALQSICLLLLRVRRSIGRCSEHTREWPVFGHGRLKPTENEVVFESVWLSLLSRLGGSTAPRTFGDVCRQRSPGLNSYFSLYLFILLVHGAAKMMERGSNG